MLVWDLIPTQDGFRNIGQLKQMVEFVRNGGFFNRQSLEEFGDYHSLIGITRFEDGRHFLRDGFHRVASICLSHNRDCLLESEYVIEEMKYSEYTEVNIENKWVTPFDPREFVRRADFGTFKRDVFSLWDQGDNYQLTLAFIYNNFDRFAVRRGEQHNSVLGAVKSMWREFSNEELDSIYESAYDLGLKDEPFESRYPENSIAGIIWEEGFADGVHNS